VSFNQLNPLLNQLPAVPHLVLPLNKYPRNSKLSVIISDPGTGRVLLVQQRVLLAQQLVRQASDTRQDWLPVSKCKDAGLKKIAVEIICHPPHGDFFTH